MAIKGKKRSRGGKARARSGAPRPTLVQRKPPLRRRTWFRATALLVLVLAAGGITYWVLAERRAAAEERAAREEIQRVGALMEGAIVGIGGVAQHIPVILPELGQALSEITTGDARPRRVEQDAAEWEEGLEAASERLASIRTDRGDLRRAITGVRDGLDLYLPIARDLPDLTRLRGDERAEAAAAVLGQMDAARAAVDAGWEIYRNARAEVGLEVGTPGVQPQIPPGGDPFAPPGSEGIPVPIPEPSI